MLTIYTRDWLIVGCFTAQRISDLLQYSSKDIITIGDVELLQIQQKKTKKNVSIPIHEKVKKILDKRDGNFPRKISDQKFNKYIKEVAEIAGINSLTEGNWSNPETKRKEFGTYEKYKIITSHCCRYSFATNFYGKIPTSLLTGITAHSTEKQYLDYVGKPEQDKSLQIAEIWKKQAEEEKSKINVK